MKSEIKKILVVDDSPVSRMYFISMMNSIQNIEFIQAGNGTDALNKIETEEPDCILLDHLMPDKTGTEVLEEMGNKGIKIPAIMLTADIQKTTKEKCMQLGAFAFLNKPVDQQELIETVNKALKLNS